MNQEEWNQFVDKGTITDSRCILIAFKLHNGQTLLIQEVAMYQANPSKIELQLLQILHRTRL